MQRMPVLVLIGAIALAGAPPLAAQQTCQPESPTVDRVDEYHGVEVRDPYRWLEDVDATATKAWITVQNCATFEYLSAIPERERVRQRLTTLWDYPRYGTPFERGGRYFFLKNDGLQNQSVLYQQETLEAEPQVLLDPNGFSEDGTVALATLSFSEDGRRLVYGKAAAGSDWREFHVRDVDSGADLRDHLRWIKFSTAAWTHDGAGFFYSRYPAPTGADTLSSVNRNQKLYYHRLGTSQDEDVLVYERPDQPDWGFSASVTDDGRYLVVHVWLGTDRRNRVHYMDLQDAQAPVINGEMVQLLNDFDAGYSFVGNDGPMFWFLTDLDAPRGRLVAVDIGGPDRAGWRDVIPQREDKLESVRIVHETFVAEYLHDAHTRIALIALDGTPIRDLELPGIGSVSSVSGERDDDEMFYAFTSYLYPTTIFRFDFTTDATEVFKAPEIAFDPSGYETEQVFYTSKDGTRVPMFVTHKKGIAMDGSNPTYLYGYGGFNISLTPSFSVSTVVWLELGGVYAVPNLRGGGEYGEEWHRAGMLENKQNVFDDFIAAAEYLIAEGYTSTPKLAIGGGSNGGLLVGAVLNQRPDLVGAALPAVGVMDMLRFHKFTIGWAWVTEYGSADSVHQFPYLYDYSPLHNIRPGASYPATLITTADHDDRVVPGHSFKYAAALQAAQGGPAPILIRVETRAGHGAGKPTVKIIEEQADRWSFLVRALELRVPPDWGPRVEAAAH